jgi:hypothetical protein
VSEPPLHLLGTRAELEVLEVLRDLPGRRRALAALLDGKRVFAKLFAEEAGGLRRARREERRALSAARRGLRTAEFIGRDRARDEAGRTWALILQSWIPSQGDFRALSAGHEAGDALMPLARELFAAWGDLHARGLDHRDPHLGNLLRDRKGPVFVDLGATRPLGFAFGLRAWLRAGSLGSLFAQIDPSWWLRAPELLTAYRDALGADINAALVAKATQGVWKNNQETSRRKRLRACGDVEVSPLASGRLLLARRSGEVAELRRLIANPDSAAVPAGVSLLRPGDQEAAVRGWSDLWLLRGYGLPVPAPLALVENGSESLLIVSGTEARGLGDQDRISLIEETRRVAGLRGVEATWENAPSLKAGNDLVLGAWALRPRFLPPTFSLE